MSREELLLALRPIHLLESPAMTAMIMKVMLVLLLLLTLALILRRVMTVTLLPRRQQWQALAELKQIEQQIQAMGHETGASQFAAAISRLLRRYALLRFPDKNIAGLSGITWLQFLDQHGGNGFFGSEQGMMLVKAPYCRKPIIDPAIVVPQVRHWIKANS